jgi:hypothetical protein
MRTRKPEANGKGDWPRAIKLSQYQKNFDGIKWDELPEDLQPAPRRTAKDIPPRKKSRL